MKSETIDIQSKWEKLLAEEQELFNRCVEIDNSSSGESSPEKGEAVRAWWSCANAILWMMVRVRCQHDHELLPYPAFTLGRLANISEEISEGKIPSFVLDAKKGGRAMWRKERHHIAKAVHYLLAVEKGEIMDRHPTKTVRLAYDVTGQTVRNWKKQRDRICLGVPKAVSADGIVAEMLQAGSVYARIGRGAPSE